MSFLDLEGKTILVLGVANKKSVAYHVALQLLEENARVICSVRNETRRMAVGKLLPDCEIYCCDVDREGEIEGLAGQLTSEHPVLHGMVHSIAFANYGSFSGRFHEVSRADFLQCIGVSCHSLIALSNALKKNFDRHASVVTISISTTRMAVESYGYMAPAKAALDSSLAMLAKSFSEFSEVRFNGVCAGLLRTSASAGIPGYIDHYMYAEQATLRKRGITTEEVAAAALFLLSGKSSGVNAQGIVVDGGMSTNYFDQQIVKNTLGGVWPAQPNPK